MAKKGFGSRIAGAWRALTGQTQPGIAGVLKDFGGSGISTSQHPLQKMIGRHLRYNRLRNPRSKMALSRLLIQTLPFFKRAVNMQADFVGRPVFHSEIPELTESLTRWAEEVPILFHENTDYRWFSGLDHLAAMMVRTALTDGMAFAEERYTEIGTMEGIEVLPTERFSFQIHRNQSTLVYHQPGGGTREIAQSMHFHAFGVSFMPGSLWGLSITDGAEFFSELLINMLIARKNNYLRLGNPPGLNIFTLKNHENFTDQDYEEFKNRVKEIEKDFMEAIYASQNGQNAEVFGRLAGDIEYSHKIYGEGAQGLTGFREDVEWAARQLSLLTGIPPEFLGFETGSAGIGADKFRILNGLLTSTVEGIQNLLRPILVRLSRNYLEGANAPAEWWDAFTIEFSEPDINDRQAIANTQKAQAEALGVHLQNASRLWFELGLGDVEVLNEYFRENGLPWLQLTAPPEGGGGV